jgi:hypothetical protein
MRSFVSRRARPPPPASTAHYLDADFSPAETDALKIHSPALIVFLLVIVKALEPFFGKPKRQPPANDRQ